MQLQTAGILFAIAHWDLHEWSFIHQHKNHYNISVFILFRYWVSIYTRYTNILLLGYLTHRQAAEPSSKQQP